MVDFDGEKSKKEKLEMRILKQKAKLLELKDTLKRTEASLAHATRGLKYTREANQKAKLEVQRLHAQNEDIDYDVMDQADE